MLAALALVAATLAPARAVVREGPEPPRLVVLITVDQLRPDYLVRFRPQLTGGLARLLREGAVFTAAYQDHAMTETSPGFATILSGRHPASTGIVRNDEGVGDVAAPLIGVEGPGASPRRFRGTTLVDWLLARNPGARVLSVSRKDRGAILPVGRSRQAVFWYQRGIFTTSTYYADSLPAWLRAFNARALPARAAGRVWEPLLPLSAYAEPDSQSWENGGRDFVFPHRMPEDTGTTLVAFAGSPWIDDVTLDLALEGARQLRFCGEPGTDLLAVSPSATDNIGHSFGPNSVEIQDQILRLDRALGTFLDSLARICDPRVTVIALTADHGVTPFPEYSAAHGDPTAQRVSFEDLVRVTRTALAARAGPGSWLRYFSQGLLVMDRAGLESRGVHVDSVVDAFAAEVRRSPVVLRVDTPRALAVADTAVDVVARRWRHSVPADLGAELMVTLRPNSVWGGRGIAEHGQPSEDDTHVPLILAGRGIGPGTYAGRVSVTDLAPTLAVLAGVSPTERVDGRVLREALRR